MRARPIPFLAVAVLALSWVSQAQQQRPPGPPPRAGAAAPMCPTLGEDTKVSVSDVDGGVALTFTSERGDPELLLARVQHLAMAIELHSRSGGGQRPGRGPGRGFGGAGPGMMMMTPSRATAEDLDRGARLVLRPMDATQLDRLRADARTWARQMESGECPMWGTGGAGLDGGSPRRDGGQ